MGKLTLEDLRKLRENVRDEVRKRESSEKSVQVLVGMGTCGIAAGARETLQAFSDEIAKSGLKDVVLKPTGCMGSCTVEPTVEVSMPGMPTVLYIKVTPEVVRQIIDNHIVRKQLVNGHVMDKPAADIIH